MTETAIDQKVVKKHYPNTNNDQELAFIFESDPNLCLLKNKISIHMIIELDEKYIPDNGFLAKQFSNIVIELNSQRVSNNKSSGEYWLNDWMMKYGNLNPDYVTSLYEIEGYYDRYTFEGLDDDGKRSLIGHRRTGIPYKSGKYIYEFIMTPNESFLNENHPLPPGIEMKISFDRLPAQNSCISIDADKSLHGAVLDLKDVYAQVEYISSPILRSYFDRRDVQPITYKYDELSVLCRSIPTKEQYVRLDNIKGGNTPDYVFFGLVKTAALNGSLMSGSLNLENAGVKEVNLTLNGNSCNGFPLRIQNNVPLWPYHKFFSTLGRLMDNSAAAQMRLSTFENMVIYAHKFEGEDATQGWLGVTLSLENGFDEQYTLIIWTVNNVKTMIDKFNQIEKFSL